MGWEKNDQHGIGPLVVVSSQKNKFSPFSSIEPSGNCGTRTSSWKNLASKAS